LTKILAGFGQEYFWSQHSSCVPAIKYLEKDNKKKVSKLSTVRLAASKLWGKHKKKSGSGKKK